MPVYDESEYPRPARSIAAVAIVVLVLLAIAGGWVLLSANENLGSKDVQVELPGRG